MPTQVPIATGLVPNTPSTAADATGNYVVPADGRQKIVVRVFNSTAGAITVTLDDVNTLTPDQASAFNPDVVMSVPAGADRYFLIGDTSRFLNAANGRISFTPSVAAGVTIWALGL